MSKDPQYHCNNCRKVFNVRGFIARDSKATGRPLTCPGCGNNNTSRVGSPIRQRPPQPPPDMPPTEAQLKYIIALNGNTKKITTKKEAGEYITRLKKLKEGCT